MLEKHILGHQNRPITKTEKVPLGFSENSQNNNTIKIFIVITTLILLCFFIVIQIIKLPIFVVKNIRIHQVRTYSTEIITQDINKYLKSQKKFGIFQGNALFLKTQKVSDYLYDQYPSFKNVRTVFGDPMVLDIYVDEYVPKYVWCDTLCIFSDENGYLYRYTDNLSLRSFITFTGPLEKENYEIRNNIFKDSEKLKYFKSLKNILDTQFIEIDRIENINAEIVTVNIYRIKDVFIQRGASIKIDSTQKIENTEQLLSLVLDNPVFNNTLASGAVLDYIDLRYPGKIFYKFYNTPQRALQETTPHE